MTIGRRMIPAGALILASATAGWSANEASAQQTASTRPPPREEVVVTATNSSMSVSRVPANVSILTQEDIRSSPSQTVDGLLRQVPGFNLLRHSDSVATSRTTQTVSLRGLGGSAASRTLVMMNGVPLHNPYTSEVYWARIPKYRIDRIEVVHGGGSPLWGNLAMGGVINILTEQPRAGRFDTTVTASDPSTIDMGIAAGDVIGDWSFSLEASYYDTEGYAIVPDELSGAVDENVSKEFAIVSGRATYAFSDTASVYVDASWFDETRGGGTLLDDTDAEVRALNAGANFGTAAGGTWRANVFFDSTDSDDLSTSISADRSVESLVNTRVQPSTATGASLVWSRRFADRHDLMAGVDYRWAEVEIDELSRMVAGTPTRYGETEGKQEMAGTFFQDVWDIGDDWEIVASARLDTVANEGSIVETDLPTGAIVGQQAYERNSERVFNPSFGARRQATDRVAVRAASYRGFRAATLRESYRSSSTRGGVVLVNNPRLAPERLTGVEGGVDVRFSDELRLEATLFSNTVNDMIQNITRGVAGAAGEVIVPCGLVPAGSTCQELANVGEIESRGLELSFDYRLHAAWTLSASYLYNRAEVSKAPSNPQIVGNQVRQAPKNSLTVKLAHSNPSLFDTAIQGRYVGKRYEDDLNTLDVESFFLVDAAFTRALSDTWQVFASVENLLDEEYIVRATASGFVEIGRPRSLNLGFRYGKSSL